MKELNKLGEKLDAELEQFDDDEFWDWVRVWYDGESIMDIVHDWDDDVISDTLDDIKRFREERAYPVSYITKADIIACFENDEKVKKRVSKMTPAEMRKLASKMSDDYCNQLYWDSLRIIFEDRFMEDDADE